MFFEQMRNFNTTGKKQDKNGQKRLTATKGCVMIYANDNDNAKQTKEQLYHTPCLSKRSRDNVSDYSPSL